MTVPVPDIDSRDGGALGAAVAALWELTHVLRAECPWDQAQTAGTIVPHTLEEAWEVADVVRSVERVIAAGGTPDLADLEDELGDLLFQISFLAMWCGERDASIDLGSVATRIFDMLRERGYTGSIKTLRRYVRAARPAPKSEVFLRVESLPGEQAQVDWAHVGSLAVPGGRRPLWAFVMVLAYSRAMWAELVVDMGVESLRRASARSTTRSRRPSASRWLPKNDAGRPLTPTPRPLATSQARGSHSQQPRAAPRQTLAPPRWSRRACRHRRPPLFARSRTTVSSSWGLRRTRR